MTCTEVVKSTFRPLEVAGHTMLLAQGVEVVEPPCDQFVRVGLMTDIPDDTVVVKVKRLVKSKRELHNSEARAEVATTGRHHLQVPLTDLPSHILELSRAESVQFIRMLQISEMHALTTPIRAIYGNQPGSCLDRTLGRMVG